MQIKQSDSGVISDLINLDLKDNAGESLNYCLKKDFKTDCTANQIL